MHICHLTSVHPRFDSRIFHKQCKSIADNEISVSLILADGKGDEIVDRVQIFDIGLVKGRINRMIKASMLIFKKAIELDADIYQFHDPELLYVGLLLKKRNKKVVFDSHEDVGKDILFKPYLKPFVSKAISYGYNFFEKFVCSKLDGIIGATPFIMNNFVKYNKKVININNYPVLDDFYLNVSWERKKNELCYIGSISPQRGINEILQAFEFVSSEARLNLAGSFSDLITKEKIESLDLFKEKVNNWGYVNQSEVKNILIRSIAGLVTLHGIPTFLESLPIKMFEYMSAGIPLIISDFPYWRELLKGYDCCIFVEPKDYKSIALAIDFFSNNPKVAEQMGKRGRMLVEQKFNWKSESTKLLSFYNEILNN